VRFAIGQVMPDKHLPSRLLQRLIEQGVQKPPQPQGSAAGAHYYRQIYKQVIQPCRAQLEDS
jgi:hypothetical protein